MAKERDPEIIGLPDRILADAQRRKAELVGFNSRISDALNGPIKELLDKSNFRDLSFYKEELLEHFLHTETAFLRVFNLVFALVVNRSGIDGSLLTLLSGLIEKRQLGTAEFPWNDYRFKNRLDTDVRLTPAIKYILRIQAAFLKNVFLANEFSINELSRLIDTYRLPVITAKGEYDVRVRSRLLALVESVDEDRSIITPTEEEQVRTILIEAEYDEITFNHEKGEWTARRPNRKEYQTGSISTVLGVTTDPTYKLISEAKRRITLRARQKSGDDD